MNSDQLGGIFRAIIPALAALLGAKFLDSATWTVVLTALATGGVAVWSYKTNAPGTVIPKA